MGWKEQRLRKRAEECSTIGQSCLPDVGLSEMLGDHLMGSNDEEEIDTNAIHKKINVGTECQGWTIGCERKTKDGFQRLEGTTWRASFYQVRT